MCFTCECLGCEFYDGLKLRRRSVGSSKRPAHPTIRNLRSSGKSPPKQFQNLIAEATQLRENLLSDATALSKRGLMSAVTLDTLKGNTSYKTVASDLMTLTHLFRDVWAKIVERTCVTEEELDRVEVLSDGVIYDQASPRPAVATHIATAPSEKTEPIGIGLPGANPFTN